MKVILLQDVAKIGRRFDVVDVPSGYGMNKLIPQGMAKPATPENLKAIHAQADKIQAQRSATDEAFQKLLDSIEGAVLEIVVEANEEGRMFQALKVEAVVDALKSVSDIDVSQEQILIKTPIKEVGEHTVTLVSGENTKEVPVKIISK